MFELDKYKFLNFTNFNMFTHISFFIKNRPFIKAYTEFADFIIKNQIMEDLIYLNENNLNLAISEKDSQEIKNHKKLLIETQEIAKKMVKMIDSITNYALDMEGLLEVNNSKVQDINNNIVEYKNKISLNFLINLHEFLEDFISKKEYIVNNVNKVLYKLIYNDRITKLHNFIYTILFYCEKFYFTCRIPFISLFNILNNISFFRPILTKFSQFEISMKKRYIKTFGEFRSQITKESLYRHVSTENQVIFICYL